MPEKTEMCDFCDTFIKKALGESRRDRKVTNSSRRSTKTIAGAHSAELLPPFGSGRAPARRYPLWRAGKIAFLGRFLAMRGVFGSGRARPPTKLRFESPNRL